MATPRQIEANRLNAMKSTGPRTDAGKARSSQNALKHALSGKGLACQKHQIERLTKRKDQLREMFLTQNDAEEWLFQELCLATVQMDVSRQEQNALIVEHAHRAETRWDEDRRDDAIALAAKIDRDPELTVARLRATRQGCLWLAQQWEELGRQLEVGPWDRGQEERAFDLLGTHPSCRRHLPWADDPAGFAHAECGRYRDEAESLVALDDYRKNAAENGLTLDPTPALRLMRRYEAAAARRYDRAQRILLKAQETHAKTPPPPLIDLPLPLPRGLDPALAQVDLKKPQKPDLMEFIATVRQKARDDLEAEYRQFEEHCAAALRAESERTANRWKPKDTPTAFAVSTSAPPDDPPHERHRDRQARNRRRREKAARRRNRRR